MTSKNKKKQDNTKGQQDDVWVQLATRIPKELHRNLKMHCVDIEQSVMSFIVEAIELKLSKSTATKVRKAA